MLDKTLTALFQGEEAFWHPEYGAALAEDGLDVDMVYTGNILAEVDADNYNAHTLTIGEIEDEDTAIVICEAMNAMKELLRMVSKCQISI